MRWSIAFAPGHVTGFFSIHDSAEDVARRGSRGAGFCVERGATIAVQEARRDSTVIDGVKTTVPVINDVLKDLRDGGSAPIKICIETGLPFGQGFGMSGAIALATAIAVVDMLGSDADPVLAAHRADVLKGTGLGDVAAQSVGGFEMRTIEGVPPYGEIRSLPISTGQVYLAWTDTPLSTPAILGNPDDRRRISEAGAIAHAELAEEPTLENFCRVSRTFAERIGLLGPGVRALIGERSLAGMCMLGNAAFSFEPMENALVTRLGPAARLIDRFREKAERRR